MLSMRRSNHTCPAAGKHRSHASRTRLRPFGFGRSSRIGGERGERLRTARTRDEFRSRLRLTPSTRRICASRRCCPTPRESCTGGRMTESKRAFIDFAMPWRPRRPQPATTPRLRPMPGGKIRGQQTTRAAAESLQLADSLQRVEDLRATLVELARVLDGHAVRSEHAQAGTPRTRPRLLRPG